MQVADAIAIALEPCPDALGETRIGHGVEQNAARGAHQADRPTGDNDRADNTDQRVDEQPTENPGRRETGDRKNRNQRVGDDMHIGGAQIGVVVMASLFRMVVIVIVVSMIVVGMMVVVMLRVSMAVNAIVPLGMLV